MRDIRNWILGGALAASLTWILVASLHHTAGEHLSGLQKLVWGMLFCALLLFGHSLFPRPLNRPVPRRHRLDWWQSPLPWLGFVLLILFSFEFGLF